MIGAQRYTGPRALDRLRAGRCPECGGRVGEHDSAGGPRGCTLTDNGVAQRVHAQHMADQTEQLDDR